jgi:putative copper export protein
MSDAPNLGVFPTYEEGKHRRYGLLFSVNGGAFAIVQFLAKDAPDKTWRIGHLDLHHLAWGMLLFTILMIFDIYTFGEKMRKLQEMRCDQPEIFQDAGKLVLLSIGALICGGWFLAGIC